MPPPPQTLAGQHEAGIEVCEGIGTVGQWDRGTEGQRDRGKEGQGRSGDAGGRPG